MQPSTQLEVTAVVHVARVLAGPFPGFTLEEGDDTTGRLALDMDYLSSIGKQDAVGPWMIEASLVRI